MIYQSSFPREYAEIGRSSRFSCEYFVNGDYLPMTFSDLYPGPTLESGLWAHPNVVSQMGCSINRFGEMRVGVGHAEPVVAWTSPYPDGTTIRVEARFTCDTRYRENSIPAVRHKDRWLWNMGAFTEGASLPVELELTVDEGDTIRFHLFEGHGPQSAAGAIDWDIDNRRNSYLAFADSTRHLACSITAIVGDSPGGATYHLDPVDGSDEADGLSPETAWRSLARAGAVRFAPGDSILLRAGRAFHGTLSPLGSGAAGAPVTIGRYGDGPDPAVHADGVHQAAVYLVDQHHWRIEDLEVTNRHPEGFRSHFSGISVRGLDGGDLGEIHIRRCSVHDVSGYLSTPGVMNAQGRKTFGGIVVNVESGSAVTRFSGVLIEGCVAVDCDRVAIQVTNFNHRLLCRPGGTPFEGVVIRHCTVERAGGDSIMLINCVSPLVEHCVVRDGNYRDLSNVLGISTAYCTDGIVQFCEVSRMHSRAASQAFGADHGSKRTIIQYNYSHDNEGGFFQAAARGKGPVPNDGAVVRYNISQNDEANVFLLAGPVTNARIYNNTIFLRDGLSTTLVSEFDDGGVPFGGVYSSNLFVNEGGRGLQVDVGKAHRFEANVVSREPAVPLAAARGSAAGGFSRVEPRLERPGTGGDGIGSLDGYRIRAESECRGLGVRQPDHPDRDFFGTPIASDAPIDAGAHQVSSGGSRPDATPGSAG